MRRHTLAILFTLIAGTIVMAQTEHEHHAELKHADGSWKYTNALVHETSPYLLQHAHNPVNWMPWGDAAFEKARREDKPIFLSIGYSTCYWCHVMERQSFEDPDIAAVINENTVPVKVDREERPDVDDVYMTATQMMTGHGGWPMSVFLTHDLKPFHAGTYYPPKPMHGRPGFPQLVEALGRAWRERRQDVLDQADRVAQAVTEHLERPAESGDLSADPVQRAAGQLLRLYDQEHGGFGGAPKFPTPSYAFFLLAVHRNNPDPGLWRAIAHTLDRMARGGMYDQVGGGFHRYSVDEKWLVPHFEKMLYDNAQLVELYAQAYRQTKDDEARKLYERVIRETCDYVIREMLDDTGAFWSAQDAEVEAREGGNYVWTREQIEAALGDPDLAAVAIRMYGLDEGPNFQDPHAPDTQPVNVLYLPRPLAALAEGLGVDEHELRQQRKRINARLKEVRDDRPQPSTDDKVLVAWNGMMIAAFADAGRTLAEPRYTEVAAQAADAIQEHMSIEGEQNGLYRTMRNGQAKIPAFLEDYAFYVHGLIALGRAQPGGDRWIELAKAYTQAAIDRFAAEGGGYFDTLAGQSDLFVRTKSQHDGAIPSGNSVMIHNLLDLHEITGERAFFERAVNDLRSFAGPLSQNGANMAFMQHALLRALETAPHLAGEEPAEQAGPVTASVSPERLDVSPAPLAFEVRLVIEEGYHLNAHEPSLPDLIPTELLLDGARNVELEVEYPDPVERQFDYAEEPLRVYEGSVVIRGRILATAGDAEAEGAKLRLRYQACDESQCLPPREITLPVELSSEP